MADNSPFDSPEWWVLLGCIRDWPEAPCPPESVRRAVNWPACLNLARAHGLVPLLHAGICRWRAVPDEVLSGMARDACQIELRNLDLTAELVRLLAVLQRGGITATPYKGPALAARLYGDVALRQFGTSSGSVCPGPSAVTSWRPASPAGWATVG